MFNATSPSLFAKLVASLALLANSALGVEDARAAENQTDAARNETLTGDWGGTRSHWRERGVDLDFELTQFYQGVVSGGVRHDEEYNGTFETDFQFDFGKLAGWKFWRADIETITRFGGPALGGTGTINPVNTAALIPGSDDTVFSITAANVTRLIPIDLQKGDLLAVSVGRFNMVALLDEDFFAGGGTERFMNMAQIGPLTVVREVPLITNAVNFAYVRHGEPFITLSIMDPNDHSVDSGLSEAFEDGVTFAPGISFPAKYFGKTAKHSFGGAITTKEYTPFDSIRQLVLPGPARDAVEPEDGSWSINYVFRQYLVERGKGDGWGMFTQLSFANQSTSPIAAFFDIGLGGNGLFESRRDDEFGIAYAYTDLSDDLKDNLASVRIRSLRAEHQIEMFYNAHITPWCRLTGNLQVIRPTSEAADTAIVPAVRLQLIF